LRRASATVSVARLWLTLVIESRSVSGWRFVLLGLGLACSAGGGSDDEPPCTFEGSYFVAYTLVSGDPSCPSVAPRVELVASDEQACTTACAFADGNPCETTFTCQPGNPVLECAGVSSFNVSVASLFGPCEFSLRLMRLPDE
jgi:hypothetical protein